MLSEFEEKANTVFEMHHTLEEMREELGNFYIPNNIYSRHH
jgi:hypothetical protein